MPMKKNNSDEHGDHRSGNQGILKKIQFFPAAVTPFRYRDLSFALSQHLNKKGLPDFEKAMCSFIGTKHAYSFTSFMRAIYACLIFLKKSDKRFEIIIPRYSCPSFAHAILAAGLRIRYCDINPLTLSLDMKKVEQEDLKNVLAIICVNYFGLSNPMDEISNFCKNNDIYLIEDLGYSLGSEYNQRKLGTFGDFSVYNFQEGKAIPVGGGMITTNRDDLEGMQFQNRGMASPNFFQMTGYKIFSNPYGYNIFMGISRNLGENGRKRFSMEDTIRETSNEFDFSFDPNCPLLSLSNFQGALGFSILSNMSELMKTREKNALLYNNKLSDHENIIPIQKEKGVSKVHYIRYPILVGNNLRDSVLSALLKNGIEASSMYSDHGIQIANSGYSGAERISNEILTLPCHPFMNYKDIEFACEIICDVIDNS